MKTIKTTVLWLVIVGALVGLFFVTQYALVVLNDWAVQVEPEPTTGLASFDIGEHRLLKGGTFNTSGMERLQ